MPDSHLLLAYEDARRRDRAARDELVPLVRRVAIATLADVLPGAATIEAIGEFNEDWIPTLRIQRVRNAGGRVLFDVATRVIQIAPSRTL